MSNLTSSGTGQGSLGTIPIGHTHVAVTAVPEQAITGQATNTRRWMAVEIDPATQAVVQVVGLLQFDAGVNAPAGQTKPLPAQGAAITPGHALKIVSEPVGSGLAQPKVTFEVSYS